MLLRHERRKSAPQVRGRLERDLTYGESTGGRLASQTGQQGLARRICGNVEGNQRGGAQDKDTDEFQELRRDALVQSSPAPGYHARMRKARNQAGSDGIIHSGHADSDGW